MPDFWVSGIVSGRDKQPYIQLSSEKGMIAQLTMGEARKIALDILVQCSRCEADAMVLKFLSRMDIPEGAGNAFLIEFRDFRAELDEGMLKAFYEGNFQRKESHL